MAPHGIREQLAQAFHRHGFIDRAGFRHHGRPVAACLGASGGRPDEHVSGGELCDAGEGGQRIGHVPQAEERRNPTLVQSAREARQREQRAELRAEGNPVRRQPVAQGLDAEAIPRQDQLFGAGVPQGDREHPAQSGDAVRSHLLVEVDDRLGIALRVEAVPAGDQIATQVVVIVDLAVEHDLNRTVLVADRLLPPGDVDDRQPAHAQRDFRSDEVAAVVRAAVDDGVAHRAHRAGGLFGAQRPPREPGNAAHRPTPPPWYRAPATCTSRSGAR